MQEQIDTLLQAIIDDYNRASFPASMREEFANGLYVKMGKKYIKIMSGHCVWGFIVNTDTDKQFRRGDILKAASWNAPARNRDRGNILDGGYRIKWTGPHCLK